MHDTITLPHNIIKNIVILNYNIKHNERAYLQQKRQIYHDTNCNTSLLSILWNILGNKPPLGSAATDLFTSILFYLDFIRQRIFSHKMHEK